MSTGASLFGSAPVLETVVLVPGQLTKEILVNGAGETPKTGHRVKAHYTGKLMDGSVSCVGTACTFACRALTRWGFALRRLGR
jgi:hypothetical protein